MKLYMNNQEAISIIKNSKDHTRTKHIDVQHHYIRELMREGVIVSRYVRSRENVADILTKALSKKAHEAGVKRMRMRTYDSQQ